MVDVLYISVVISSDSDVQPSQALMERIQEMMDEVQREVVERARRARERGEEAFPVGTETTIEIPEKVRLFPVYGSNFEC